MRSWTTNFESDAALHSAIEQSGALAGQVAPEGSHTVFVAEVVSCGVQDEDARPLAPRDTGWPYGGLKQQADNPPACLSVS